jgi:predicted nucleic acid-binding protein
VRAFFDTNILIYAQQSGAKADKARAVLAAGGALSVQVLNEFVAVSRRKLGKDWGEIGAAIDDILALVDPPVPLTLALHTAARGLAGAHDVSFYDALIVVAAREAKCNTLYSEDMQNGRAFDGLVVTNPFRPPRANPPTARA